MPRNVNKFPLKEGTNFQRVVSLKLKEKGLDWTHLYDLSGLSESHFRSVQNGTRAPSLEFVWEVAKFLKVTPKTLLGTDTFSLGKQSVARSKIPELCKLYDISLSDLSTHYQIPATTAKRIMTGGNANYKTLSLFYMNVFRGKGVKSILDLIEFEGNI